MIVAILGIMTNQYTVPGGNEMCFTRMKYCKLDRSSPEAILYIVTTVICLLLVWNVNKPFGEIYMQHENTIRFWCIYCMWLLVEISGALMNCVCISNVFQKRAVVNQQNFRLSRH